MEEEQTGVTLGDIFRVIFSEKWLALIIAAVITIVGSLGIILGYNSVKNKYTTSFNVNFAGSETGKYPDNVAFDYREIVSPDNVKEILNDPRFKGLDESKISRNLSISRNYTEVTTTLVEVSYKVEVKASCFDDEEQAADFLSELVNYPVRHVQDWAAGLIHNADLMNYDNAKNFDDKINYLNAELEYIDNSYLSLLGLAENSNKESLNADEVQSNYRAASGKINEIKNEIQYASSELIKERYVLNMECLKNYAESYPALKNKLDTNTAIWQKMFENLKPENVLGGEMAANILNLAETIIDTENDIEAVAEYLKANGFSSCVTEEGGKITNITVPTGELAEKPEVSQFKARLDGIRDELDGLATDYGKMFVKLHDDAAFVTYEGSLINVEGGLSKVLAIVLSLVVGVIIACIVALVKAMPAYLKQKRGEAVISEAQPEVQPDMVEADMVEAEAPENQASDGEQDKQ